MLLVALWLILPSERLMGASRVPHHPLLSFSGMQATSLWAVPDTLGFSFLMRAFVHHRFVEYPKHLLSQAKARRWEEAGKVNWVFLVTMVIPSVQWPD